MLSRIALSPDASPSAAATPDRRRTVVITWALGAGLGALVAGAAVAALIEAPPGRKPLPLAASAPPPEAIETKPAAPTALASNAAPVPLQPRPGVRTPPASVEPPPAADATPPQAEPANPPMPDQAPLAFEEVREVQGRLRAIGFNPGWVDGTVGPMTVTAVRDYQWTRGLPPSGTVDRELLARLRSEAPPPRYYYYYVEPPRYAAAPRRDNFFDRLFRR